MSATLDPTPAAGLIEVFARSKAWDPDILLRLFLGRVEASLPFSQGMHRTGVREELFQEWKSAHPYRVPSVAEVMASASLPQFIKQLFNHYFRNDLYGDFAHDDNLVLSSGAADETVYPLPSALKDCIRTALDRDWYGYSDSLGRESARGAISNLENTELGAERYTFANVGITFGGTAAISALAQLMKRDAGDSTGTVLCAIPNYPPLVAAIAEELPVELVPLTCNDDHTDASPLLERIDTDVRAIMVQTVTNPTGTRIPESQIEQLVKRVDPSTLIILDECHECFGPMVHKSLVRASPNVVRVRSLSKSLSAPGIKVGWVIAAEEIIDRLYEYASTTYGGPPSLFYLATEVFARLERWFLTGIDRPTLEQHAEWESTFAPAFTWTQEAFASYRAERTHRSRLISQQRSDMVASLRSHGMAAIDPAYSFNVAVHVDGGDDYARFRQLLHESRVSVYPGVLAFALGGDWIRLTTARSQSSVVQGLERLVRARGLEPSAGAGPELGR